MTYQGSEVSVSSAKPVELYKFVGTYANFFYTSGPVPVTFLGDTYLPIAIKRSEVKAGTQEDDGLDLSIDLPSSSDLAQTYGFSGTPPKLALTIYRYHRGAPTDYVAYWTGPVTNINTNGGKSTVRSPSSLGHALQGNLPNVYYQAPCNHVLFDSRCGIVEADWTVVTTVSAVDATDGKKITVLSVGTLGGKLVGGELSLPSGERRMITAQVGNVVTVNFPFFALTAGTAIGLVAGCDHAYGGDCSASKFNNQVKFGGFPFIPAENVFQTGMQPGSSIPDNTCLPSTFIPVFHGWTFKYWLDIAPTPPDAGHPQNYYPAVPVWTFTDTDNGLTCGSTLNRRAAHDATGDVMYGLTSDNYIVAPPNGGYDFAGLNWYSHYAVDPGPAIGHGFDLRLQFPSGGVFQNALGQVAKGRLYIQHWTDQFATLVPALSTTSGQTIWGDGYFNVRSLWPDDWTFTH